jgi:maltose alpha-D-glucosyltransferase / alpha-amylase
VTEIETQVKESGSGARAHSCARLPRDPQWYKDAIVYEVHVRAFLDSNADGIGDFRGLTQKLDYLQDLGITAIWLLPFYPSPLKDDGYDIADYYAINPIYGTLRDFRRFLAQARQRNLRVITELVVNHTSDQHPWFQRSRRAAPGTPWRNFYVWSDTPEKYREARIIFRDFELSNWTWDPVARAYYWHRFYSHQPDLNYDNPLVHREIQRVLDFWMDLGVDGVRLDAVPYLYEREGTSCENLPETHAYLQELRRHVDERYGDRMLLAEANQWPEEAVTYFGGGKGDECHMAFHFPLMPRIFMAVRMEDRVPIIDILEQTPAIPESSQWALFLRNHDELTLEMVTDEERDYMYRVYANDAKARLNLGIRRRLAPLLGNDRKRIELLHLLLFSLPGTPVLYYGDEIGMGDNVFLGDRNGVRTPMQWSSDKNAGFSRASPQALYLPIILDPEYHYEAINVENQQRNPSSLCWWMKRALNLRKRYRAFGRGSLRFLVPENRKVLAFIRQLDPEIILVVANLSRFPQPVALDLAQFQGLVPVELFGRTDFPPIGTQRYSMTLSPHTVLWFSLETASHSEVGHTPTPPQTLVVPESWNDVLRPEWRSALETALHRYIPQRPWFRSRERELKGVQIREAVSLPLDSIHASLLFLRLDFTQGEPEDYLLSVAVASGAEAERVERETPQRIITRLQVQAQGVPSLLYSAFPTKLFCRFLLESIARRRTFDGLRGELKALPTPAFRGAAQDVASAPLPHPQTVTSTHESPGEHRSLGNAADRLISGTGRSSLDPTFRQVEYSNNSVIYGDRFFLKVFRRLEPGIHPELEMGSFLTARGFANVPAVAGSLEYRGQSGENMVVGILTRFIPNAQDAWVYTIDMLSRYLDRARTLSENAGSETLALGSILQLAEREAPEPVVRLIGTYMELARLLGQRSAELHLALASAPEDHDFGPEPFTPFYQRAWFQSMRNLAVQGIAQLRACNPAVSERIAPAVDKVIGMESQILQRMRRICGGPISARRIRCHGDFHLGQVLFTGKDFLFIDFEGDTTRSMGERRIKRSPLRDVACMIRSFDYITQVALFRQVEQGAVQPQELPQLQPWMDFWYRWVSATFLKYYLARLGSSELLPTNRDQLSVLLEAHLLEKALYEITYELTHRPDWVRIPLHGILQLMEPGKGS